MKRNCLFTSPYSESLVDYVEPFVDAYKIGSGDVTYSEIIKNIKKRKACFNSIWCSEYE